MKTFIFGAFTFFSIFFITQNAAAQDNQATFEAFLKKVYDSYQSGNNDAMWSFYTDNSAEITPDGRFTSGKQALKAGWDEFMGMVDGKPSFTYKLSSWRLITPDVALVTWDSTADIKVQGQQMGGPSTCVAVLRKIKGEWKIEFDGMTPVIQMPSGN